MAMRVTWQAECDHCGIRCAYHAAPSEIAEAGTRTRGWLFGKIDGLNYHLCPVCKKNPPEWWKPKE